MLTRACWFASVGLIICLHVVSGLPARRKDHEDGKRPKTIDEVMMETSEKRNLGRSLASRAMPSGMVSDGMDMMLTPQQYMQLRLGPLGRGTKTDIMRTWPNLEIPYRFGRGHFTPEEMKKVEDAMAQWENLTCVVFRPFSVKDTKHFMTIMDGSGCWSNIGMLKTGQLSSLDKPGCLQSEYQDVSLPGHSKQDGVILHELGHTMGLTHEHQRPDRDDYISINLANVKPGYEDQLTKYAEGAVDTKGVNYSYASIMHYGKTAFSANGEQTISTGDKATDDLIGQREGLAFSDVKLANLLYDCSAHCTDTPSCSDDCFVDKNCRCFCEQDMPGEPCEDLSTTMDCEDLAKKGVCVSSYWRGQCPKSCGVCTPWVPAGSKPGECKNESPDPMCDKWESQGFCHEEVRLANWMKEKCKRSCGICSAGRQYVGTSGNTISNPTHPGPP